MPGFLQLSRGHLEFFPTASAGWNKTPFPYWGSTESLANWQETKVVFLIPDMRTFPFAFPNITEEDENGYQIVTYPEENTRTVFPHLDDTLKKKKTPADVDHPRNALPKGKRVIEEEKQTERARRKRD